MFEKKREESKEFKVGRLVLNEDDLKFQVNYKDELFTIKHLAPYERQVVEAEIVRRLGGFPRNAHDPNHVAMVEAMAYVEASIIREESPDWFKSAWTCYDEDCIVELYRGLLDFSSQFQQRLAGGPSEGSGKGGQS